MKPIDQEVVWCDKCEEYHVRIGNMILTSTYVDVTRIGED